MLYKYVSVYHTYTLYKPHVHRRSQDGQGAMALPNFSEYPVILRFKRQHLKQNAVARLISNILTHPNFGLAMPLRTYTYLNSCFIWVRLGFLWTKDEQAARLRTVAERFSIGGLCVCAGMAWHSKNWQNLHWFNSVSRFNLGGLEFCLEG